MTYLLLALLPAIGFVLLGLVVLRRTPTKLGALLKKVRRPEIPKTIDWETYRQKPEEADLVQDPKAVAVNAWTTSCDEHSWVSPPRSTSAVAERDLQGHWEEAHPLAVYMLKSEIDSLIVLQKELLRWSSAPVKVEDQILHTMEEAYHRPHSPDKMPPPGQYDEATGKWKPKPKTKTKSKE